MRFIIETDTLRAEGSQHFPHRKWEWEVTRAGVDNDQVRLLLCSGTTNKRLLETITYVLGKLAAVAREQAELMEHETKLEEDGDESTPPFNENGSRDE